MHTVILSDLVEETRETGDGRLIAEEIGFWQFTRTIELPFRPYRGLVLATDPDDEDDAIYFHIKRVVWDLAKRTWFAYGDFGVVLAHESTPERLKEDFPEWEMRWIDDHSFDAQGKLLAPNQEPRE